MRTQAVIPQHVPPPIPVSDEASAPQTRAFSRPAILGKLFALVRMGVFGPLCCFLSALTSIAVVGWTFRFSQRTALKHWYRRSPQHREGERFQTAAARIPALATNADLPNWVLPQKVPGAKRRWLRWSLIENLWIGFKGFATALVLLALPGFAMMFAWWGGWENSFGKGYEQAPVGPVTSILAMLVTVALIFYVPMAHARQAVSGKARAFFGFRTVLRTISHRWYWVLGLTAAFGVLSVPLFLADAFLGAATSGDLPMADYNPDQALAFLNNYFFGWCVYLFGAYLEPVPKGKGEWKCVMKIITMTGLLAGGCLFAELMAPIQPDSSRGALFY